MSAAPPPPTDARKRALLLRYWPLLAGVSGVGVLAGAALFVLGPGGPSLAAALADGREIWRLGVLDVEGVSGDGLGDLNIARASLSDEQGVWAIAENLRLSWKPLDLLGGDVTLTEGSAQTLRILRRPILAAPEEGGPVRIDTDVGGIRVNRLELAPGVTMEGGAPATFSLDAAVATARGALRALQVDLQRVDAPLDTLTLDYRSDGRALRLEGSLEGAPQGAFAQIAQAPDQAVRFTANGTGTEETGQAVAEGAIGGAPLTRARLNWTAQGWSANADLHLGALPAAAGLTARLGETLTLTGAGERPRASGAPFQIAVSGRDLSLEARGRLNDAARPVGAVAVLIDADALGGVAPELGLDAGGARFDGALEMEAARTLISGRVALRGLARDGFVINAEGPIEATLRAGDAVAAVQLASDRIGAPAPAVTRLLARAEAAVEARYDRQAGVLRLTRVSLTSPAARVEGQGRIEDGAVRFDGDWALARLAVAEPGLRGAAQGKWKFSAGPERAPMTLVLDGAGRGFGGLSPLGEALGEALGPSPQIQAQLGFGGAGVSVNLARVNGRNLRLGAQGRIDGPRTDLRLEASARGPLKLGAVTLAGAGDATGRLTGEIADPRIEAEARLAELDIAGAALARTTLRVDLAPDGRGGRAGLARLEASYADKPLTAEGRLDLREGALTLDAMQAQYAQLKLTGRAVFDAAGPQIEAALSGRVDGLAGGVEGAVSGQARFSSVDGQSRLALSAELAEGRFGPAIATDRLSILLDGPLDGARARLEAAGWAAERPFTLAAEGAAAFEDGFSARLSANGAFDGAPIATTEQIVVVVRDGVSAQGALRLDGGTMAGSWRSQGDQLAATLKVENAPLELLTSMFEQPAAGRISGVIALSGATQSLNGEADFMLADARLARRSSDAVDAQISAKLGGGVLRGRIDAKTQTGLAATIEGEAPVIAQAAPFHLAGAPGGVGSARWALDGPVEGLWALFGPLDQRLAGLVAGSGRARFGQGGVSGDGRVSLSAGAFEDKITGIALRDLNVELSFDPSGVQLNKFEAGDGQRGRVSGSGRLNGQESGRLDLTLSDFRLLNRPDALATGDGKLALDWRESGVTLSGDIALDEAEVRLVESSAATIPEIDVIEINRPGPPQRLVARQPGLPGRIDIAIRAPRRVFTRTRGLDAEWSLDMQVRGDIANPGVFGTAELVRGDFDLAGRRFALESGVVTLNGAVEDATVNLVAVADTAEITARVAVTGRALDPEIALSSEPALPEDEILPQLLFGRSARELSAFEAAQLAASLASLTGQAAFDIAGAARAAVNLDRLEVREQDGGLLLAGGKYLTRDVYLEVARGALGETTTSVEWEVRPRLFVISSFLPNGDQRLSVRWRRDY